MSYYHPGGTLPKESPTYVTRQADQELYDGLAKGEFCYVLNARQMGKSSLQVRTRQRLEKDGLACAVVDLTKIGGNALEEAFYAGIIQIIAEQLPQLQPFDLDAWWEKHRLLSPLHHLATFLEGVLLARIAQQQIVIFIDESDAILKFAEEGKGNFFSLIRTCYNDRPEKPAYQRLTFAILGVASPADLIADKKMTPFNIGRAIDLVGFQAEEVGPLAEGLRAVTGQPAVVLARVLYWTGGQPFLTQKIGHLLSQGKKIPVGEEVAQVDQVVQSQVLDHWEVHDEPTHLRHIRDRIFREGGPQTGRLLELYQAILSAPLGEGIVATESRTQLELRLSGLVVKTGHGRLQVYNPIYARVFNLEWVAQALTLLRPYAQNLRNWQDSQEESWLLRGPALQAAQTWAKEKHLGDEDYKFLAASHQLETRVLQQQKRWQRRAIWGLVLFLVITAGLMVVAGWQWQVAQSKGEQLTQNLGEVQRLRDQGLRTQSLFLADLARQETEKGNATNGILLAVEALPKTLDSPERPYVNEAKLALYDAVVKNRELKVLTGHTAAIESAAISPDGQLIATASEDGTARLWEMNTGKLRYVFKGQGKEERMNHVAFSPDGQNLLVASSEGVAYLLEVKSGKRLAVLTKHESGFDSATFSPNGQQVVTTSWNNTAQLWEVPSGKLLAELKHKEDKKDEEQVNQVNSATFSPSGRQVVTASDDKTARLWNVKSGKLLAVLAGHKEKVNSATFSPDSSLVLTTLGGNPATLWNVHTGEQVAILNGHEKSILHAAFSPDGRRIVTSSADGTAILWPVFPSTQALLDYARQIVPRQLSCQERGRFFLVEKGECRF